MKRLLTGSGGATTASRCVRSQNGFHAPARFEKPRSRPPARWAPQTWGEAESVIHLQRLTRTWRRRWNKTGDARLGYQEGARLAGEMDKMRLEGAALGTASYEVLINFVAFDCRHFALAAALAAEAVDRGVPLSVTALSSLLLAARRGFPDFTDFVTAWNLVTKSAALCKVPADTCYDLDHANIDRAFPPLPTPRENGRQAGGNTDRHKKGTAPFPSTEPLGSEGGAESAHPSIRRACVDDSDPAQSAATHQAKPHAKARSPALLSEEEWCDLRQAHAPAFSVPQRRQGAVSGAEEDDSGFHFFDLEKAGRMGTESHVSSAEDGSALLQVAHVHAAHGPDEMAAGFDTASTPELRKENETRSGGERTAKATFEDTDTLPGQEKPVVVQVLLTICRQGAPDDLVLSVFRQLFECGFPAVAEDATSRAESDEALSRHLLSEPLLEAIFAVLCTEPALRWFAACLTERKVAHTVPTICAALLAAGRASCQDLIESLFFQELPKIAGASSLLEPYSCLFRAYVRMRRHRDMLGVVEMLRLKKVVLPQRFCQSWVAVCMSCYAYNAEATDLVVNTVVAYARETDPSGDTGGVLEATLTRYNKQRALQAWVFQPNTRRSVPIRKE
ncbi:hypothetical protein DIPPA_19777 [Diplonema papillatum]|nr:hypothetical protein DIPPA_19777 [Diplonema papillatum]